MNFINEIVYNRNEESLYQVALDPEGLTVEEYINKIESKNEDYYDDVFENLKEDKQELFEKIRENITVENKKLIKNVENWKRGRE